MPLVWDETLCVGHKGIDDDHEHLVALYNRFEEAVHRGESGAIIVETVCALAEYSMSHFTREEHAMIRSRYPRYDEHKVLHDGFLEQLTALANVVEQHNEDISEELLGFLKGWIVEHLMSADQDLSDYLCEGKVAVALA
ncbi:MAG: hemerythrin family protein [Rhodospirillaceae bacterium]|nr:hemerythrin family protein [Rhodospirillaceae bacterium]